MEFYKITPLDVRNALVNLTQVTFEVTDACNLNCTYCCYGDLYEGYDCRENSYLSFEQIKQTLDYLAANWKQGNSETANQTVFISFYGGEPLLNMPAIRKTIEYVEGQQYCRYRDICYSMTTNGVLLEKYMDYLVEKKIRLLVSMDGDEKGQSYRVDHAGNNSFAKVYHNLKQLQKKHPEYFEKYIAFNSVLHNRNGVVEAASFIQQEFQKLPNITQLSDQDVRCDKATEFTCMQVNYGESLLRSRKNHQLREELPVLEPEKEELRSFLEHYSGNVYKDYNYLFLKEEELPIMQTGSCFPFSKKVFITVKGKIMPCERISQEHFYGWVTDRSFGLELQEVADKFNAWIAKLNPLCTHCYRKKGCEECAFQGKGLDKDKIKCSSFADKKLFQQYAGRNLYYLSQNPSLYQKFIHKNDVS